LAFLGSSGWVAKGPVVKVSLQARLDGAHLRDWDEEKTEASVLLRPVG
jgi:hypothetical protein